MDRDLNQYYLNFLKKRNLVEGIFAYLKNHLHSVNRFCRSIESFQMHVYAALAAYSLTLYFKYHGSIDLILQN
jgi:hypothetical protein